ncbi:MAG: hypothetical protein K2M76_05050 [Muribaculaceae bacterium]|nr:hypothetical protein [Muribaculaceae bacterium]
MENSDRRAKNAAGIFSLWWGWAVSAGLTSTLFVVGLFVSARWIPLVAFVLHLVLGAKIRHDRTSGGNCCNIVPMAFSRVLLWSAVVMVVINCMHTRWFAEFFFDRGNINAEIPFICALIVNPVALACALWTNAKGRKNSFCRNCRFIRGDEQERGFLGLQFSRESKFQLNLLVVMSLCLSIACWTYYFVYYINVNLNTPDLFMFRWLPLTIYAMSLGYLGLRYVGLWGYYMNVVDKKLSQRENSVWLRFLIICGDMVFVHDPAADYAPAPSRNTIKSPEDLMCDTPARMYVPLRRSMTDHEAATYLRSMSHLQDVKVRYIYKNTNYTAGCNIFHYATFLDDQEQIKQTPYTGEWCTLQQLQRMDRKGMLSPYMSSEISRIYRVVMAWKTYDREGRRLYPIKNYQPTFRLRDFHKWDVDINDPLWLFVSTNNEDKPFYRIKRLWRRYVNGIGK